LSQSKAIAAVELTNSHYWRTPQPSNTFHGRDIFAPVGAHLARGVNLSELGEAIAVSSLVQFPLPAYSLTNIGATGCIQYIDRFGNLITNIPGNTVTDSSWSIIINQEIIPTGKTYSDVAIGELIALVGSHGWIEIAVNSGSAKAKLSMDLGDTVVIQR
jgi:hypothetical protein